MNSTMIDPYGRTPEQVRELKAKVEAADREARQRWGDPVFHRDFAQEMTQSIYWGFEHENLISQFLETERLPWDGRSFVKETRGLQAFWMARGSYQEASSLNTEVMEIPRDQVGIHVFELEDKLRANFSETQATLVDLAIQRLDATINQRVIQLFQAGIPTTSAYYSAGAGLSLTALDTAIRQIADISRAPGVANTVSIIGRASMTYQIVDRIMGSSSNGAGFLLETNEQLMRLGVLGTYRGARIITLSNYLDDADQPFFPGNELYVVGRDAGKFAWFGGLNSKEWVEDSVDYWHYRANMEVGAILHRPNRARRIVDTSISAT